MTPYHVYISGLKERSVEAVKAVRAGLQEAEEINSGLVEANEIVKVAVADGYALVCTCEGTAKAREVASKLKAGGMTVDLFADHEQAGRILRARKMSAEGATPEQVFAAEAPGTPAPPVDPYRPPTPASTGPSPEAHRAALAIMASVEGHPVRAGAQAVTMARATGQIEFYAEVVSALAIVFPWIIKPLRDQQFLNPDQSAVT